MHLYKQSGEGTFNHHLVINWLRCGEVTPQEKKKKKTFWKAVWTSPETRNASRIWNDLFRTGEDTFLFLLKVCEFENRSELLKETWERGGEQVWLTPNSPWKEMGVWVCDGALNPPSGLLCGKLNKSPCLPLCTFSHTSALSVFLLWTGELERPEFLFSLQFSLICLGPIHNKSHLRRCTHKTIVQYSHHRQSDSHSLSLS